MTQQLMRNYQHFVDTAEEYKSKWVAIIDGEVVASGSNVKDVYNKAIREHPSRKPLIAKSPSDKIMIL